MVDYKTFENKLLDKLIIDSTPSTHIGWGKKAKKKAKQWQKILINFTYTWMLCVCVCVFLNCTTTVFDKICINLLFQTIFCTFHSNQNSIAHRPTFLQPKFENKEWNYIQNPSLFQAKQVFILCKSKRFLIVESSFSPLRMCVCWTWQYLHATAHFVQVRVCRQDYSQE